MHVPTATLAAFRSLRPCTCWILADRGGGGVAVEGKCGVRNPQTASWSTPNMVVSPANRPGGRGDRRGYSRPARRDVPTAGVWCVPGWPVTTPPWYVTGNARIDVGRSDRPGSIFRLGIREPRRGSEPAGRQSACGANAGECYTSVLRLYAWASPWVTLWFFLSHLARHVLGDFDLGNFPARVQTTGFGLIRPRSDRRQHSSPTRVTVISGLQHVHEF